MKRTLILASALGLALLSGCPDPGVEGPSPTPSPDASASPSAPADPLEGSLFSREELFAIYAAQMAPADDAAARALLLKQRLLDAQGAPVKARQEAYQRALKRFAERDPGAWSEFVNSLIK